MIVGRRMTREVITALPEYTLRTAASLMKEHRIHHLPVLSGGELVGIVTDTDIRNSAIVEMSNGDMDSIVIENRTVGQIMTRELVTVTPWDTVEDALLLLQKRRFGALPVVEGRRLVGIITKADVLSALIDTLHIEGVGVRMEVVLSRDTASILRLVRAIGETGVEMKSLILSPFGEDFVAFIRLSTIDVASVRQKLKAAGFAIPELSDFLG